MFSELAQELGPEQRSLVASELGAEGLHEGCGPGGRDAEELFDVAAGEEGPVEVFEPADGVGNSPTTRCGPRPGTSISPFQSRNEPEAAARESRLTGDRISGSKQGSWRGLR